MLASLVLPPVAIDVSPWSQAPFEPGEETVFAIGDVHGCAAQLVALLERIRRIAAALHGPTRLVYLGDLIDRGPDSLGVLELWAGEPALHGVGRIDRLMGNHEMTLLHALGEGQHAAAARARWLGPHMGGAAVLAQMRARAGRPDAPLDRALAEATIDAAALRLLGEAASHLRLGNLVFVHGGLRPGLPVEEFLARPWTDFLEAEWAWIMADFLQWKGGFGPLHVVHGHTPPPRHRELTGQEDPHLHMHGRLGLDGGSSRNGIVVAAQIERGRYRILRAIGPPFAA